MIKLYAYQIDPETLETTLSVTNVEDDYPEYASEEESEFMGGAGYASYGGDFGGLYAESLISAEDAKRLVYDKCRAMWDSFGRCLEKMND